ncbi:hypothetical protein DUI87_16890 [Hirundo rustica rustica]|uniref:Uncharacterized protein n=1 Tax=Hirundo rustica rustica TaxID=333673 RepID=A0A3M0K7W9_HIRRU|nr:hypothetical protein DUI87_16890 [Hirundo rustica rustica]
MPAGSESDLPLSKLSSGGDKMQKEEKLIDAEQQPVERSENMGQDQPHRPKNATPECAMWSGTQHVSPTENLSEKDGQELEGGKHLFRLFKD